MKQYNTGRVEKEIEVKVTKPLRNSSEDLNRNEPDAEAEEAEVEVVVADGTLEAGCKRARPPFPQGLTLISIMIGGGLREGALGRGSARGVRGWREWRRGWGDGARGTGDDQGGAK